MVAVTVFVTVAIHNAPAAGAPGGNAGSWPPRTPRAAPGTAPRLAAWILRVNPKAAPYASLLAARIVREGRRRRIPFAVLTAIAWIESDYRRGLKGAASEIGVWQLGARQGDHKLPDGWNELRRLYPAWPIVKATAPAPWAKLTHGARVRVIDDIRAGTFLAALEIRSAADTCYRMRNKAHRAAGRTWGKSMFYLHKGPDIWAHYNSGVRRPRFNYRLKLRRRTARIRRWLRSKP